VVATMWWVDRLLAHLALPILTHVGSMEDDYGPLVAESMDRDLMKHFILAFDDVAYAVNAAVRELRAQDLPASRWANVHSRGGFIRCQKVISAR
jgi:hypothetical protein